VQASSLVTLNAPLFCFQLVLCFFSFCRFAGCFVCFVGSLLSGGMFVGVSVVLCS